MQAAVLHGHGGNEVVRVGPHPTPARAPGEVRVRVRAATLNRVDLYMRDSGAGITHPLPMVMGLDACGTVDETDPGETRLRPGQRVVLHPGISCGRCEFCLRGDTVLCTGYRLLGEHRDGSFAQYVCLPPRNVFPCPAGLSDAQAAALGVNHLTAWRMLFTKGQLKPWHTVLVFGVGGGVSLAALQLARMAGATVIVTSREPGKLQRALELGAHHTICSATQDVAREALALTQGRGVDLVIENVGAAVWPAAMKSVRRGGTIVTCGATTGDQPGADLRRLFIRQVSVLGSTLGNEDEFAALLAVAERGLVQPVIDATYPLQDIHAAFDHLESGRQFGKIALAIE